jgi:hypothetical protein
MVNWCLKMPRFRAVEDEITTNESPPTQAHIAKGPKLRLIPEEEPAKIKKKIFGIGNGGLESEVEIDNPKAKTKKTLFGVANGGLPSEVEVSGEENLATLAKGAASGATLGLSEYIPGLALTPEEQKSWAGSGGKFVGSVAPITKALKLFSTPLVWMASKSPILVKQAQGLARILGAGLTGAAIKGAEDVIGGKDISADDMIEHGAVWGAIDAALMGLGYAGKFSKALYRSAQQSKKPAADILKKITIGMEEAGVDLASQKDVAKAAFAGLAKESEATASKNLAEKGIRKVDNVTEALTKTAKNAEPHLPETLSITESSVGAGEKQLAEEAAAREAADQKIADDLLDAEIETFGERAESRQELGEAIQEDIESSIQKAEKEYDPIYQEVDRRVEGITHSDRPLIKLVLDTVERLESVKTAPERYKTVIKTLKDMLHDIGYATETVKNAKGKIVKRVIRKQVPLKNTMEVARRLNKIINYDITETSIKNVLKGPKAEAKRSILRKLQEVDPLAVQMFTKAEGLYQESARKYNTKLVRAIRRAEKTENLANIIKSPSTTENVNKLLSKNVRSKLEREFIEELKASNFKNSMKQFREMQKHLTPEARRIGRKIIESKRPKAERLIGKSQVAPKTRRQQLQGRILRNLEENFQKGTRPDATLKLWKNPRGRKLISDALKEVKNKEEVLKYLREQSFHDFSNSVLSKNGKLDVKKFSELIKNPSVRQNIRDIGGMDAVRFFNRMASYTKKLELVTDKIKSHKWTEAEIKQAYEMPRFKNIAKREAPVKHLLDAVFKNVGAPHTIGTVLGMTLFPGTFLSTVSAGKVLHKLASSPRVRNAVRKAASSTSKSPVKTLSAIDELFRTYDQKS